MNKAREPVRIVPKGWGREVWIANGEHYCGKILEIRKGKRCSLHYHKLKTESFYLRSGRLKLRVMEAPDSSAVEEFILNARPMHGRPERIGASDGGARGCRATSSRRNISTATPIAGSGRLKLRIDPVCK